MKKIELGDLFELETSKGKAYFQCVKIDKSKWDIIKVYNKLYNERPLSTIDIINLNDNYFVGFIISAALKKNLINKVGNVSLEQNFKLPLFMREEHVIGSEKIGWHIVNTLNWKREFIKDLTAEQICFSPWGIWNDTFLKYRLENRWNLQNWK